MNSLLVILSMVAMASAIPLTLKAIPVQIAYEQTQASSYRLKTDHPVQEPAPIIKGVPQPYAVPVPQPYAVPRAVTVEVPRPVPVTVTRTVGVPVIARGEPIVRTRVVRIDDDDDNNSGLSLGGLSLGGLSLGDNNGYGNDNNGYGNDNNGYGGLSLGDNNGLKGLSLISLGNLRSKY